MKGHFEIFPYVWLGGVALFGLGSLTLGIYELRRGSARWGWSGARYERSEEPFYFWVAVLARLGGFVVACLMFYMGLDMLTWR